MAELSVPLAAACAHLSGAHQVPLAFFGHSMGASVAHEVALRLTSQTHGGGPAQLFASGRPGPGRADGRGLADASDEELKRTLSTWGERTRLRLPTLNCVRCCFRRSARTTCSSKGTMQRLLRRAFWTSPSSPTRATRTRRLHNPLFRRNT
ncbi:hypothetical protein I3F60_26145 [Streptomyces sp. MUM 136J]|nr:hypothetical protein [Streptomyces sp. MUM 2J]MCH0572684.1 hypothetical protein [Streptomyces sp. MUM 136J]